MKRLASCAQQADSKESNDIQVENLQNPALKTMPKNGTTEIGWPPPSTPTRACAHPHTHLRPQGVQVICDLGQVWSQALVVLQRLLERALWCSRVRLNEHFAMPDSAWLQENVVFQHLLKRTLWCGRVRLNEHTLQCQTACGHRRMLCFSASSNVLRCGRMRLNEHNLQCQTVCGHRRILCFSASSNKLSAAAVRANEHTVQHNTV